MQCTARLESFVIGCCDSVTDCLESARKWHVQQCALLESKHVKGHEHCCMPLPVVHQLTCGDDRQTFEHRDLHTHAHVRDAFHKHATGNPRTLKGHTAAASQSISQIKSVICMHRFACSLTIEHSANAKHSCESFTALHSIAVHLSVYKHTCPACTAAAVLHYH